MQIVFIHRSKAFLPELEAYVRYFASRLQPPRRFRHIADQDRAGGIGHVPVLLGCHVELHDVHGLDIPLGDDLVE